jgi:SAM-dependent methyltransferase
MAEHRRLYRRADYYDIVFDGDVEREIDFAVALHRRHTGVPLRSALELACGPGYHARALAARGVRAVGLDLSREMIALAREKAAAGGLDVDWLVGDMRDFGLGAPVDMAICTLDGIDCLLTDDEIVRHFRAVAANLVPGGLYVIELSHPRDCSAEHYGRFRYEGERNGCRVTIDWANVRPVPRSPERVVVAEVVMLVKENGTVQRFVDRACERFLSAEEIARLAGASGALEVCAWYGDFDVDQPFDDTPASRRMMVVLGKPRG